MWNIFIYHLETFSSIIFFQQLDERFTNPLILCISIGNYSKWPLNLICDLKSNSTVELCLNLHAH